jgi:hypothetical protein
VSFSDPHANATRPIQFCKRNCDLYATWPPTCTKLFVRLCLGPHCRSSIGAAALLHGGRLRDPSNDKVLHYLGTDFYYRRRHPRFVHGEWTVIVISGEASKGLQSNSQRWIRLFLAPDESSIRAYIRVRHSSNVYQRSL